MMKRHFEMLAAYNRWANERLYECAAALPPDDYNRDVGAFFKSMNGTLNHILVGDRIWMKRFTGRGDHPDQLDAAPFPQFAALRKERFAEDARIVDWVDGLDEGDLGRRFSYVTITDNTAITQTLAPAMTHLFNHQTHHRGQAHTILSLLGVEPPPLDLLYFHRADEGQGYA